MAPVAVVSEVAARAVRANLEAAEAELADDPERLGLVRAYPGRLLPSFGRLTIRPDGLERRLFHQAGDKLTQVLAV